MRLTDETPKDWRNLQDLVCKYLNESGYHAVSPKTIETVRGNVEVDVYVTAKNELIRTFICECKYWNTAVPKEKIHAFRTVVQDSGATIGIFIAKEGFQSGAIEAARCSNVLLKDWDGFLELIREQWIFHQLLRLKHITQPLSVYTDFLDVPLDQLEDAKKKQYMDYLQKYLRTYIFSREISKTKLQQDKIEGCNTVFSSCRELFDFFEKECTEAVEAFKKLFEGCSIEAYKFECGGHMMLEMMEDIYNFQLM